MFPPLEVVIEVLLRPNPFSNFHDMRGQALRGELKIIAGAAPQKTAVAEQIVRLKCVASVQAERGEIEIYPTRLFVKRVQIAKDNCYVGKVVGRLAVADHLRI